MKLRHFAGKVFLTGENAKGFWELCHSHIPRILANLFCAGGHTLGPSLSEGLAAVFFGGEAGSPFLARRKNKTSDTQGRVDIKSRIFLLFIYLKVVNLVPMAFFPSWGQAKGRAMGTRLGDS